MIERWDGVLSSPKVDHAIKLVKELVQSGRFGPGDRLPNEADLAGQLKVSRNSLREAVRAMQTIGILEARQGDGTYVSELDPGGMMDVLRFAVDVSDARSVLWYLELRQVLEIATVQEAAVRRSPDQLSALKALHAKVLAEDDADELMTLDGEFHNQIAEIGGNPVQAALLRVVSAPTVRARIGRQRLADRDFLRIRCEHQRILDAIERQRVDEARYAMWGHLSDVISWVRKNPDAISRATKAQ